MATVGTSPQPRDWLGTLVVAALVIVLAGQLARWTWIFATPPVASSSSGPTAEAPVDLAVAAKLFGGSASQSTAGGAASTLRLKGVVAPTPGVAASAIFVFVTTWNEVFAAALLTFTNRTLPAQMLAALDTSPLPYRLAGGFFLLAPALVVIFLIRRYLLTTWGRVAR